MKRTDFIPLPDYRELAEDEMVLRAADFVAELRTRRTVRHFSDRPVPEEVLRDCVAAAASAPSGANRQPWHFVIISDPKIKKKIREDVSSSLTVKGLSLIPRSTCASICSIERRVWRGL